MDVCVDSGAGQGWACSAEVLALTFRQKSLSPFGMSLVCFRAVCGGERAGVRVKVSGVKIMVEGRGLTGPSVAPFCSRSPV